MLLERYAYAIVRTYLYCQDQIQLPELLSEVPPAECSQAALVQRKALKQEGDSLTFLEPIWGYGSYMVRFVAMPSSKLWSRILPDVFV